MDNEDMDEHNRISLEVNVKDGLKIDVLATKDTGRSVNLVLKTLALTIASPGNISLKKRNCNF